MKKLSYWRKVRPNRWGFDYEPDTDSPDYALDFADVMDEGEPIIIEASNDTKGEEVPPESLVSDTAKRNYLRSKPKKPKT